MLVILLLKDKTLLKAQLDWAAKKYGSEFRNFPRGKNLTEHVFDTVKRHQGITAKKLIRVLGLPKTTVYDHVKYLVENERSVRKIKGQLYTFGSAPKVLVKCGYHNITVLFLVHHQVGILNELCQFVNELIGTSIEEGANDHEEGKLYDEMDS